MQVGCKFRSSSKDVHYKNGLERSLDEKLEETPIPNVEGYMFTGTDVYMTAGIDSIIFSIKHVGTLKFNR